MKCGDSMVGASQIHVPYCSSSITFIMYAAEWFAATHLSVRSPPWLDHSARPHLVDKGSSNFIMPTVSSRICHLAGTTST